MVVVAFCVAYILVVSSFFCLDARNIMEGGMARGHRWDLYKEEQ